MTLPSEAPAPIPAEAPAPTPAGRPIVLEARGLTKSYRGGDGSVLHILEGLDLRVARGEMVAVVGASGAGKSTLLHLLGALDRPTAGEVLLDGELLGGLDDDALAAVRNRKVGFVFQFHHLLREFSALENVMIPQRIAGVPVPAARARAEALLARVGLAARMHHRPGELSGGEQQRTAVARALASSPAVLLADEPTGNLDERNAELLHDILGELARDLGMGMVVVTHNPALAARADRVLHLGDGRVVQTEGPEGVD
jgi:lipoprotein-releasing system ATP-binding protein